jgi:hypothetical protein
MKGVQIVGGVVVLVVVVLLVVLAVRKTRHDAATLRDVLHSLEGQWVTVVVGGFGDKSLVTLTGGVQRVEGDRLFLDRPSTFLDRTTAPDALQGLLLGPVRPDEGIVLDRVRSVRGPRGAVHWP